MKPGLLPQRYLLEIYHQQDDGAGHRFCGRHEIPGADCPNCEKPLLRFFSFDMRDTRLSSIGCTSPWLHLLNCWTCDIAFEPFFYQLTAPGGIKILQFHEGCDASSSPFGYEIGYPDHFPAAPVKFIPLSTDEQHYIQMLNRKEIDGLEKDDAGLFRLGSPSHQLGGEPWLVQQWDCWTLECPLCHSEMSYLASVGDNNLLPHGFVGNEFVQFVFSFCPACQVVGAKHSCD